jgi:hypothetical protein
MRVFLLASALLLACSASAQTVVSVPPVEQNAAVDPAHQATPEQIREYFTLLHLDAQLKSVMSQMVNVMKTTAPSYIPRSFWNDMDDTMNGYDFMSELVPIYQKHLTREDMVGVLAFYHSDAGRHLIANQEIMTAETQKAFRAIGERLGEQVGERHADDIAAAKKKYEDGLVKQQMNGANPK